MQEQHKQTLQLLYSGTDATSQGYKPLPEPPRRAVGNCFPPSSLQNCSPAHRSQERTKTEHQTLRTRPPWPPHPSLGHWASTGCTRSQRSLSDFIFNKSRRVNQAAAVKGHNSRETCLAFSVRALRGISNVIQILSPLAFHLFIYRLGQQWPKSLLRSDSCLEVCARQHGALRGSSCLLCPSSLNQGTRP